MNLLHTFAFPSHNLYIYDTVDPLRAHTGHVHVSMSDLDSNNTQFCTGVSCYSTPCHFNNYEGSCTRTIQSFIREQLSPTHPEYFL